MIALRKRESLARLIRGERIMKKPIDHRKRAGKAYEARPPPALETLLLMSEKMKEFNRRTGKVTAMGNRHRRSKPKV